MRPPFIKVRRYFDITSSSTWNIVDVNFMGYVLSLFNLALTPLQDLNYLSLTPYSSYKKSSILVMMVDLLWKLISSDDLELGRKLVVIKTLISVTSVSVCHFCVSSIESVLRGSSKYKV